MGLLDEWGNALVEEGLREAADTFFGARTALDEQIATFESRAAKLGRRAEEIRSWFAGLNCLLGSESNTRLLFDSLGVILDDPALYTFQACSLQFRRPRSFTRKGLFAKTVWEIYEPLARLIESYMHGTPYTDPLHPGRVMISVNHDQLRRHCDEINARIQEVNESNRPSESLAFAKRMDQTQVHKESVTGGGGQTWTLDQDLAYPPLVFENYALPSFPDLPLDSASRSVLEECCAKIFARQREHVDAILDEVFDPDDKTICVLDRSGH
ncbi:MAG: hypothetical protein AB7D27_03995 [Desulfomicrobium sp.]